MYNLYNQELNLNNPPTKVTFTLFGTWVLFLLSRDGGGSVQEKKALGKCSSYFFYSRIPKNVRAGSHQLTFPTIHSFRGDEIL
jgi:hypothetical protein